MAWFFKKKLSNAPPPGNLRRRFHHFLIERRKHTVSPSQVLRQKRAPRALPSPALTALRKFSLVIIFSGIALGLIYTVFFSSFFTVNKVTVEKNGQAVSASSLGIFLDKMKGKNLLFLNTGALEQELEQTFKHEILLARIKKSYPKKLILTVEEHPAVFNFHVIAPEKTQKFVLNQIGHAIFENSEQPSLPTLTLRLPKPFPGKGILIEKEKMAAITEAFQKFTDLFAIEVASGEWKKTERELHLKTEKNFFVWLDLTAPIEPQLKKLKRALPKLDIYRTPLEYIDLRIAGGDSEKVIFKRK